MKSCIVIPARYSSTRLPGKVLLDIAGKPMIQWVYEKASMVKSADNVIIATDNAEVSNKCKEFGAKVIMTSATHQSGTDRIGEIAEVLSEYDIFINIQGDEPLIDPECINSIIHKFKVDTQSSIVTLISEIENDIDLFDFNVVKVVKNIFNKAIYFSRNVIPANRDLAYKHWLSANTYFRHIGVYGFKTEILLQLIKLKQSNLEKVESLEQLRWIENGYSIDCLFTDNFHLGVDTESDLEKIRNLMSSPLY